MPFPQLINKEGPSPAVKLHQQYVRLAPKNFSAISDWQKVLLSGVTVDRAAGIIRFIQNGGLPSFPHSRTIAKNAAWYSDIAQADPVASRVPVSVAAFELATKIADAGFEIEAEYVQDALNQYRDYFAKIPTDGLLYLHLPPARVFVEQWFAEIAPRGTARMRRFHLEHTRFKEFIRLTARAARRG